MSTPEEPQATLGRMHESFRMQRHRQILNTAMRILSEEGLAAVSMQRVSEEMECAIGTIYQYVSSKSVLIAELQRDSLDTLSVSFALHRSHVDDAIAEHGLDAKPAALVRVLGAARFWIDAESVYPHQIELSRQLFVDQAEHIQNQDATRALPTAMRFFERARLLAEEAIGVGAMHAGRADQRAVIVVAGTTGVLMTRSLSYWDPELFQGPTLASVMVRALFVGWGADPALLDEADRMLATLAGNGRLVPAVPISM